MENKQTAVEWLVTELNQELNYIPITQWDRIRDLVQRAKAMEKEQIIDAYNNGDLRSAELYYDETYVNSKTPPGEHCEEA